MFSGGLERNQWHELIEGTQLFRRYPSIQLFMEVVVQSCRPQACNFIKKETLAQEFSCEFCEISKKTFSKEHLWWLLLYLTNFSNLTESLLVKLPDPSNKYNLESVFLCYSNFAIPEVFHIKNTLEEKVFRIMENTEICKSASIDKLPGRILKDVTEILGKSTKFTTFQFLVEYFLMLAKLQNSNLLSRKAKKSTHLITGLSCYCH